jgi:hypothetical protein
MVSPRRCNTGHFALDEQADTIVELVADFIARNSR